MTFAQIQADAESHLASIREGRGTTSEHVEKTTQLVCALASELAARESVHLGGPPPGSKAHSAARKRKAK